MASGSIKGSLWVRNTEASGLGGLRDQMGVRIGGALSAQLRCGDHPRTAVGAALGSDSVAFPLFPRVRIWSSSCRKSSWRWCPSFRR